MQSVLGNTKHIFRDLHTLDKKSKEKPFEIDRITISGLERRDIN